VLDATYQSALPVIPRVPLPTREAVESAIELVALTNPEARDVDPTRFFDPRFVQELQDSGFIQGLYQSPCPPLADAGLLAPCGSIS
jgi:hypothetical protein